MVDVFLATSGDQLSRDGQLDRGLAVAAILGKKDIAGKLLAKGGERQRRRREQANPAHARRRVRPARDGGLPARTRGRPAPDRQGRCERLRARLAKRFPRPRQDPRHPHARRQRRADALTPPRRRPWPPPRPRRHRRPIPPWRARRRGSSNRESRPADVAKRDTGQDDDKDGFTNDEELAAGTNPNDPNSHPPYYTKLRLQRIDGGTFPVVFEGTTNKGSKVALSVREKGDGDARRVEVEVGSRVPGMPFRVERVRARSIAEKDTGRPLDVSELTLTNTETKRLTVLVKGMTSNSADARAVLRLAIDGSEVTVAQGEEFALPRDPATRFQVIDIRPTQVVLKIVGTAQTVTVEK